MHCPEPAAGSLLALSVVARLVTIIAMLLGIDLGSPLVHAARLFTDAPGRGTPTSAQGLVGRIDGPIVAAETLLRALLAISKLDPGGVQPAPERVALAPLLTDMLADQDSSRRRSANGQAKVTRGSCPCGTAKLSNRANCRWQGSGGKLDRIELAAKYRF